MLEMHILMMVSDIPCINRVRLLSRIILSFLRTLRGSLLFNTCFLFCFAFAFAGRRRETCPATRHGCLGEELMAAAGKKSRVHLTIEVTRTAWHWREGCEKFLEGSGSCSVGASPWRDWIAKDVVSGWQHKARLLGVTVYRPQAGPGRKLG